MSLTPSPLFDKSSHCYWCRLRGIDHSFSKDSPVGKVFNTSLSFVNVWFFIRSTSMFLIPQLRVVLRLDQDYSLFLILSNRFSYESLIRHPSVASRKINPKISHFFCLFYCISVCSNNFTTISIFLTIFQVQIKPLDFQHLAT